MNKSNIIIMFILLAGLNFDSIGQEQPSYDGSALGFGMGLDYGGFGMNFNYFPINDLGFFIGGGYALADFGVNGGIKVRVVSDKKFTRVSPFLIGMYGYNTVIKIENASQYNKLFYGTTIGFGVDFLGNPHRKGYLSLALLIPIRNSNVNEYIDDLKNNHGVNFTNKLTPVTISIGYKFVLAR